MCKSIQNDVNNLQQDFLSIVNFDEIVPDIKLFKADVP